MPLSLQRKHTHLPLSSPSPPAFALFRFIFQNSNLGYAQYVAVQSLAKLVSKPLSSITTAQKLELKQWALQMLFDTEEQQPFVTSELCRLCGLITKLCWFETDDMDQHPFRTVMTDAMRFVDAGGERLQRGVQLLHFQVTEMNKPDNIQGLAKHRKVMLVLKGEAGRDGAGERRAAKGGGGRRGREGKKKGKRRREKKRKRAS